MTHCSDDDLVLHHYGESAAAAAHVAVCPACAQRGRELAAMLAAVPDEVPERGDLYGREVWYRVRPRLEPAGTWHWWPGVDFVRSAAARWTLAAVTVVLLVGGGFVAGRLSLRPAPVAAPTRAASTTDVAAPQFARRVLLMTVADHLERSDRILTDIMNAPGGGDLSTEQQWANELVAANRLYRQDAVDADETSVAAVLEELERALLDIVHAPGDAPATDLAQLRQRIDSAALLFKVRVLTNELRQRELDSDTPRAEQHRSPIG